jgi:hypothetical protein
MAANTLSSTAMMKMFAPQIIAMMCSMDATTNQFPAMISTLALLIPAIPYLDATTLPSLAMIPTPAQLIVATSSLAVSSTKSTATPPTVVLYLPVTLLPAANTMM